MHANNNILHIPPALVRLEKAIQQDNVRDFGIYNCLTLMVPLYMHYNNYIEYSCSIAIKSEHEKLWLSTCNLKFFL